MARQRRETAFRTLNKDWRRLSSDERQARENDFILRSEGIAWSLNLDEKTERLIRSEKRPANCLANKIQRLAKRMSGAKIPIMLVLEETEEGRLHAHGVAILENWTRETVSVFMDLLRRAGGRIDGARQVALRKLFSAAGWRDYITKVMPRTIASLGSHCVTYTSREITSLEREDYTREFERQKAVRRRRAAARGSQSKAASASPVSCPSTTGARERQVRVAILRPISWNRLPAGAFADQRLGTGRRRISIQAHGSHRNASLTGDQSKHRRFLDLDRTDAYPACWQRTIPPPSQ